MLDGGTKTTVTSATMTGSGSKIVPCIWLNDQAEQVAEFYTRTFPVGRVVATSHYPESGENPSGRPGGSVLTVEFAVAGQRFTLLNGGPYFTPNPSISFYYRVDTPAEAERLYAALSEGGQALMPLNKYPWSERYGWIKDRYGVSWQVITGPRPNGSAVIAPCLMFAGAQYGKAEQAMRHYAGIFPGGCIEELARYAASEGSEGTIKHGRLTVLGQDVIAMDSPIDHGFAFNEGLSLQVMCKDQAEVDHYWAALAEGGQKVECGWLKDRYGLSWQVVPTRMSEWMTGKDMAARNRVFKVMLTMKRLDINALERAYQGE